MIILTAISFNGSPISIPPVSFDELGGSIGRADNNQMVLPDTDRTISRIHAQVVFRAGKYALIDRGSNPIVHNGSPVGSGREVLLASGDEIHIGAYLIQVSDGALAKSDDPFADFDIESSKTQVVPLARIQNQLPVNTSARLNPAFPASTDSSVAPNLIASNKGMAAGIPDDWDPFKLDQSHHESVIGSGFGPDFGREDSSSSYSNSNAQIPGLPVTVAANDQSLDALFGLGAKSGEDPLGGSLLLAQEAKPNTASNADPFLALQQSAPLLKDASQDHDSDLQAPWNTAPMRSDFVSTAPTSTFVLSWDQNEPNVKSPPTHNPVAVAAIHQKTVPLSVLSEKLEQKPVSASGVTESAVAARSESDALLQAFHDGLGVPDLRLKQLSPETMFQLGQMFREATRGTVELLAARTTLKKEVRADVTVMSAISNNALKFSPTEEFALQYLLGPPTPGFMGPVDSMRGAYDDLKAHQIGVMSGMRAALSEVLKRFNPQELEAKMAPQSALASLIPSGRKARLWELFQELYGQLVNTAEDDFEELFGKAFAKEYERCIAQLNSSK